LESQKQELSEEVEALLEELEKYKNIAKNENEFIEELNAKYIDQKSELVKLKSDVKDLQKSKGETEYLHSKDAKTIEVLLNKLQREEKMHSKNVRVLASDFEDKMNYELVYF
jgi:hypothetical protein